MAQDWSADVKKYAPEADDGIIAGIVRHCGISLHKVDSALVSFSDKSETDRVRDGFCRKKLALTQDDAEVDRVIATVGERMKADRTKNRVTVYYLLAEAFDKLQLFAKAPAAAKAGGAAAVAAVASSAAVAAPLLAQKGAARGSEMTQAAPEVEPLEVADVTDAPTAVVAGLGAAGLGAVTSEAVAHEPTVEPAPPPVEPVMAAPPVEPMPTAPPVMSAAPLKAVLPPSALPDPIPPSEPGRSRREQYISTPDEEPTVASGGGSTKWLPWLLLGLGVLALLWFFLLRSSA